MSILLAFGMAACEPVPTFIEYGYITAKDGLDKEVTQLKFTAEGGTQTIYVETTLPYWMARPVSLHGLPYVHPTPDEEGYITVANATGWMTLTFRHRTIGIYNGEVEVTVAENLGAPRTDGVYLWNDDIPISLLVSKTIDVIQD